MTVKNVIVRSIYNHIVQTFSSYMYNNGTCYTNTVSYINTMIISCVVIHLQVVWFVGHATRLNTGDPSY